jgi:alkylhydroperoxidase family enzyme
MARLRPRQREELQAGGQALFDRLAASRGFVPLLYRVMAHAPEAMAGFVRFTTDLRADGALAQRDKELAILLVGQLTGAETIRAAHRRFARDAGVPAAKLEELGQWEASAAFSDAERAMLEYVTAVTGTIRVPEGTWRLVREHFSDSQIAELTLVVACYNMVARFLEPLEIEVDPGYES